MYGNAENLKIDEKVKRVMVLTAEIKVFSSVEFTELYTLDVLC